MAWEGAPGGLRRMGWNNLTFVHSTLTRIGYKTLTLSAREAGECGGAHGWLASPSGLCCFVPDAEKEHKGKEGQIFAPEKIFNF